MKLPEIEPAQPVQLAAGAIERAGAQLGAGLEAAAKVPLEERKTELLLESEKASAQVKASMVDALDYIRSNPVVPPEEVKRIFGGSPPPHVQMTDTVVGPDGSPQQVPKSAIETHTFAEDLFMQRARAGLESAAQGITAPGWRDKFTTAAEMTLQKGRDEALDWARAQKLALNSIKAEGVFNDYVARRDWAGAQRVTTDPAYGLDPKVAAKLQAEMPRIQVMAGIQDRLRGTNVDDLQKLQGEVNANNFTTPDGKSVALKAEDQMHILAQAQAREEHLIDRAHRMEEQAYVKRAERWKDGMQAAARLPYGPDRFAALERLGPPPTWLKQEDFAGSMHFIDYLRQAPKEAPPDPRAWAELNAMRMAGTFTRMTQNDLFIKFRNRLGDTGFRDWSDRLAKEQTGADVKWFKDHEVGAMKDALTFLKFKSDAKPGTKDRDLFDLGMAYLEQNMRAWQTANPGQAITYKEARAEAAKLFNLRDDYGNYVFSSSAPNRLSSRDPGVESVMNDLIIKSKGGVGAPGATASEGEVILHTKAFKDKEERIRNVWEQYNPDQQYTPAVGAAIYASLQNEPDAKALMRQVAAEGKDPTDDNALIARAVLNQQSPVSRVAAEQNVARTEQDVRRRDVERAVSGIQRKQASIKREEEARWADMPYEEQRARKNAWSEFYAKLDSMRADAQRQADRRLERSNPSAAFTGEPDKALVERIRAEAQAREEIFARMTEQFQKDIDAKMVPYRTYLESKKGALSVLRYEDWAALKSVE